MEILTKKNFIIALIFIININFISSKQGICKTIAHCLRCPKEDKCLICKFGYRLSKDRTKCMTLREYIKAKRNMAKSSSNKETESSSKESINKKSKDEANESSNSLNKTIIKNNSDISSTNSSKSFKSSSKGSSASNKSSSSSNNAIDFIK